MRAGRANRRVPFDSCTLAAQEAGLEALEARSCTMAAQEWRVTRQQAR
jgi:hypothetical protein